MTFSPHLTERIVAAAMMAEDRGVYSMPPPARHGQVGRLVDACYPDEPGMQLRSWQGFVTSHGRFVDRRKARIIANKASQTSARDMHSVELFSEDLW